MICSRWYITTSGCLLTTQKSSVVYPGMRIEIASIELDLDNLMDWSRKWQLKFNANKCRVMHIGAKNQKHSYAMGDTTLEVETEEKNLDVIIDDRSNFEKQFKTEVKKQTGFLN